MVTTFLKRATNTPRSQKRSTEVKSAKKIDSYFKQEQYSSNIRQPNAALLRRVSNLSVDDHTVEHSLPKKRAYDDENEDDDCQEISEEEFSQSGRQKRMRVDIGRVYTEAVIARPVDEPHANVLRSIRDIFQQSSTKSKLLTEINKEPSPSIYDFFDTALDHDSDYEEKNAKHNFQSPKIQTSPSKQKHKAVPRVLPRKFDVPSVRPNGLTVQKDTFIEMTDGNFMKVHTIQRDQFGSHILIGYIFVRAETFGSEMPMDRDNLIWKDGAESHKMDTRFPSTFRGSPLINEVVQKVRTYKGENIADLGL